MEVDFLSVDVAHGLVGADIFWVGGGEWGWVGMSGDEWGWSLVLV